ncbi:MAG TPA: hypothetical protein VFQ26_01835, partial [Nitrospiraceae bacterium]|nr:hypothetical protein [Nitrospiraceae bacterium]
VLVAHSMGGLVARYFLEVLDGWRDTRALITFGTPYSGSLNAVDMLVVGNRMFGIDIADAARSMYSMHQLLPTFPCCDSGDGGLKQLDEVSLPGLDPARFASALEFHREIREAALRNKQDEKYTKRPYAICPVVGFNQPTRNSLRLRGADVTLMDEIGDSTPGGDGTVPRRSAIPDGFDALSAMYSSARHGRLQNRDSVVDHVSGLLKVLTEDAPWRGGKALSPGNISVALDDAYAFPSAITVRAKPSIEEMRLHLEVKSRATGVVERGVMVRDGGDWQQRVFKPQEPGLYLITVSAVAGKAEPVEDVIEVVAA